MTIDENCWFLSAKPNPNEHTTLICSRCGAPSLGAPVACCQDSGWTLATIPAMTWPVPLAIGLLGGARKVAPVTLISDNNEPPDDWIMVRIVNDEDRGMILGAIRIGYFFTTEASADLLADPLVDRSKSNHWRITKTIRYAKPFYHGDTYPEKRKAQ